MFQDLEGTVRSQVAKSQGKIPNLCFEEIIPLCGEA